MNPTQLHACEFCRDNSVPLSLCGGCKSVRYCNSDHQRKHWLTHQPICKIFKSQYNIVQPKERTTSTSFGLPTSVLNTVLNDQELNSSSTNLSTPIDSVSNASGMYEKKSLYQLTTRQPEQFPTGWLNNVTKFLLKDLNHFGFSVIDNFLGHEQANKVLGEVHQLHSGGLLTDGQVVSRKVASSKTIRGDQIAWISGFEDGCDAIIKLVSSINAVVAFANQHQNAGKLKDYCISYRTRAMVACYPGRGSRYVKHVDNPDGDGRCITAIYYINNNWKADDGGVLRIYPRDSDQIAQIEPKFDRMLFFWSDRRNPHEVLPSSSTRYAITVWYLDQTERETYHQRCLAGQASASGL